MPPSIIGRDGMKDTRVVGPSPHQQRRIDDDIQGVWASKKPRIIDLSTFWWYWWYWWKCFSSASGESKASRSNVKNGSACGSPTMPVARRRETGAWQQGTQRGKLDGPRLGRQGGSSTAWANLACQVRKRHQTKGHEMGFAGITLGCDQIFTSRPVRISGLTQKKKQKTNTSFS